MQPRARARAMGYVDAGFWNHQLQWDVVAAFAQQLGINPAEDADFGWIAEVGLQTPLPPRWSCQTDPATGYIYYVDGDTGASSWENPLVPYLQRIIDIGRLYLQQLTESFFEEHKDWLWHQHKQELDIWHGPFSTHTGQHYFVNSATGMSSSRDPRVETQYMFELESNLLDSLQSHLPPPVPNTPGRNWGEASPSSPTSTPWTTCEGAEVLTLEGGQGPATARLAALRHNLYVDHKSTLLKMGSAAERLYEIRRDEVESQRLQISRKVADRKARSRRRRSLGDARGGGGGPRRPSKEYLSLASLALEAGESETNGGASSAVASSSTPMGGRPAPRPLLELEESALHGSPAPSHEVAAPPQVPPSPANAAMPPPQWDPHMLSANGHLTFSVPSSRPTSTAQRVPRPSFSFGQQEGQQQQQAAQAGNEVGHGKASDKAAFLGGSLATRGHLIALDQTLE